MIRTEKRLRLCICLLAVTLVFICGNSLLPGEISQAFSDWVKALLAKLLPGGSGDSAGQGSGLLRKLAHFTEFTVLGMLLCWLFGMLQKKRYWPLLWGMAAACVDETIQIFVPGRSPGLKDVAIDSCGVLVGLILLHIGHTCFKKRSTQQSLED